MSAPPKNSDTRVGFFVKVGMILAALSPIYWLADYLAITPRVSVSEQGFCIVAALLCLFAAWKITGWEI